VCVGGGEREGLKDTDKKKERVCMCECV